MFQIIGLVAAVLIAALVTTLVLVIDGDDDDNDDNDSGGTVVVDGGSDLGDPVTFQEFLDGALSAKTFRGTWVGDEEIRITNSDGSTVQLLVYFLDFTGFFFALLLINCLTYLVLVIGASKLLIRQGNT